MKRYIFLAVTLVRRVFSMATHGGDVTSWVFGVSVEEGKFVLELEAA